MEAVHNLLMWAVKRAISTKVRCLFIWFFMHIDIPAEKQTGEQINIYKTIMGVRWRKLFMGK